MRNAADRPSACDLHHLACRSKVDGGKDVVSDGLGGVPAVVSFRPTSASSLGPTHQTESEVRSLDRGDRCADDGMQERVFHLTAIDIEHRALPTLLLDQVLQHGGVLGRLGYVQVGDGAAEIGV